MYFVLICTDKPDHLQIRMDARPAHVEFLNGLNDKGVLQLAGPFLDAEGRPNGSMVVIKAASQGEAEAIAADDPYAKAGLFAEVEVKAWNWVFNAPEGA